MMTYRYFWIAAAMSVVLLGPICARAQLTINAEGEVLLGGQPYRGVGVNYFDCFLRTLKKANDTTYDAGFAVLQAKGIPFARFCATGFWPQDMELYRVDRAEYFRRLDGVVASAEKHGIGLIPSLFWYYACVPDLVGESCDQWANSTSKTRAWMREYIREIVTRYRDRRTIWAWEFGNEYSLHADLPNAQDHRPAVHPNLGTAAARSARDDLTFAMVAKAFAAFGDEVRKYDPHRPILTGDSMLRRSAWHQMKENKWTADSTEQFAEMLTLMNPDPVNLISLHLYEFDESRVAAALQIAKKLKKPLFVGEFGASGDAPEQRDKYRRLLKTIEDGAVPLAALWVFDYCRQADFNVTADNARSWQLDLLRDANARWARKK